MAITAHSQTHKQSQHAPAIEPIRDKMRAYSLKTASFSSNNNSLRNRKNGTTCHGNRDKEESAGTADTV